jgi:hypothetical protein
MCLCTSNHSHQQLYMHTCAIVPDIHCGITLVMSTVTINNVCLDCAALQVLLLLEMVLRLWRGQA